MECPRCGTPSKAIAAGSSQRAPSESRKSGGLFDALIGNASEVDRKEAAKETGHLLVPGERIELCYKLVRDFFVFTDRRLILIDKQGVRGKKIECHSIPYKNVSHFSVETAGTFDLDAELKLFISGNPHPIEKRFRKGGADIFDVQRAIATAIVGS